VAYLQERTRQKVHLAMTTDVENTLSGGHQASQQKIQLAAAAMHAAAEGRTQRSAQQEFFFTSIDIDIDVDDFGQ